MIDILGSPAKINAPKQPDTAESAEQSASGEDFSAIIGAFQPKTGLQAAGEQLLELDAAISRLAIGAGGNSSPSNFLNSELLGSAQAGTARAFDSEPEEIAALESIMKSELFAASAPASVSVISSDVSSAPTSVSLGAHAQAKLSVEGKRSDRVNVSGEKIEARGDRTTASSAATGNDILSPGGRTPSGLFGEFGAAVGSPKGPALALTDLARTPVLAPGTDIPELVSLPETGPSIDGKSAAITTPTTNASGPVALSHPRFAEGFAQQVLLVAKDGAQTARISINPAELGPVDLRIVMRNDEVTVQLASQHLAVRDALEEALPRLREQFEQAGMRLEHGAVFQDLPNQKDDHDNSDQSSESESFADGSERVQSHEAELNSQLTMYRGFVDAYV
ncbi:MAG: hypothetical protein ACI9BW_000744 [Gammaproteobacteria bacterium]|jgi:hypothetical protein